ncbi:MAG TPA: universal stress protein [Candidatus Binatia bacterium]|nr:universal stress protein [Candidatus Binatia bacterium]
MNTETLQLDGHTSTSLWRGILVPMDFSAPSEAALIYALKLAALSKAVVHVCHVIPVPHVLDAFYEHGLEQPESVKHIKQRVHKRVKEIVLALGAGVTPHIHFSEGAATEGVLQEAMRLKPDLIVMGTHGWRGVKRFFLGSVAEAVVRGAPCPVLTLRSLLHSPSSESHKGETS